MQLDESEEASDEPSYGSEFKPSAPEPDVSAEQLKEYLEKMRPEDFGEFNL